MTEQLLSAIFEDVGLGGAVVMMVLGGGILMLLAMVVSAAMRFMSNIFKWLFRRCDHE